MGLHRRLYMGFDLDSVPQCKIVDYDPLDKIKEIIDREKLI